ncbi:MFS transporter [Salinactinospora qingdaonensis]|uniref:MFS transporter n=1 Tax=Salinactinospora qingdaonensis TaxID=702744 RepID=A0ABP7GAB4_9ACTN
MVAPLTALVICALLVLMQLYMAIPLAPIVGADLGAAGASAALATAFGIPYAVGFLIYGPLSDHYGRKAILVPGMAALAVITAVLALAPSLPAVGSLRALQGLVAVSFSPVALAYLSEALPPRWRTTAIGAVSTAYMVAGIAGQVYASAVALAWGWRWTFGLAAVALGVVALALMAILREPPRSSGAATLAQRFRQLGALVRQRALALPCLSAFTMLLTFVAMYSALGPHLQARFDLAPDAVLLVRLAGLPGMLVAPLAGALAGRFGLARVAITGFLVAAVGLAIEALASATLWALVLASVVFVAGIATTVPAMIALFGARAGQARAAGIALNGFMLFLGASAGPFLVELPLEFAALLAVLAVILACGAGLVALSTPSSRSPASPARR